MLSISKLLKKVFGSRNDRVIRRLSKNVKKINALEQQYSKLSDDELKAKTVEFKKRYQDGETLDNLLSEAFAVVREASVRTLKLRHFDAQLIGGMVLNNNKIAEMCTGEGKTLVATLPAYLNAITGKGVHIITVNDYLAKRDSEWMRPIYNYLGLTVGVNLHDMSHEDKKKAYNSDITYGTNNEFGFDYLRDNMAFGLEDRVQRNLYYAIVDEVDSILIDEARTPLIISGPSEDSSDLYVKIDKIIPKLKKREIEDGQGDYFLEEKHKQAYLTEEGQQRVEELMYKDGILKSGDNLYDAKNIHLMHYVNSALRAHTLFFNNVDYIVSDGEVVIIDEHTGRAMTGRRWSEGLHQAVEAKEKLKIKNENQTLATITFQNYFRIYEKLAGMTGTADTEAYEFQQIYNLEVIVIPTNMPLIRKDHPDKVFITVKEKYSAVIEDIEDCLMKKQPVLVGTASIENSELLSELLTKKGIKHEVLNAKQHEREAKIIAQAGIPGAVTLATNMAGRGTDIVLGGNIEVEIAELDNPTQDEVLAHRKNWQARHAEVVAAGGLHVIGSERHESRRIDNQLRGRSGRQGDPGSSRFFVSLEDNLMRIFAADRVAGLMRLLGMQDGEAIEHPWVTKAIENAQRKVEGHNFDIRKQLLQFDNVANDQRKVIYQQRTELMGLMDISETIKDIREDVVNRIVNQFIPQETMEEEWDIPGLEQKLASEFALKLSITEVIEKNLEFDDAAIKKLIIDKLFEIYENKEKQVGAEVLRQFEKTVMLQTLDTHWKEHLSMMDHLRHSIHLLGYAQKDPKQEYKKESCYLFTSMLENIKQSVIQTLSVVEVQSQQEVLEAENERRQAAERQSMYYHHASTNELDIEEDGVDGDDIGKQEPIRRESPKVGRNNPCPCGSGKKYKNCCGALK